jgi:DNA-binding GntR family transcriptional regulator
MENYKKGEASDEIYKKIKNMLYFNELAPGQKLAYKDLAKRLNTSITPVIHALKRFEDSNFVRYERNRGYFVGHITETEAKELYDAREALEISIVPSILAHINLKKLNEIEKAFRKNRASAIDRRLLILKDAQFHLRIYELSGNGIVCRLLNWIFEQICLKYRPEYVEDSRIKHVFREHRRILNAFKNGNTKEIIASIRDHTRKGKEHVLEGLRKHKRHEDFSL